MKLQWIKCTGDRWCPLTQLDLDMVSEHGVYVIWHGGDAPHVVYVGQGDVSDRVVAHRRNPKITKYTQKGGLYITWASVPVAQRDGIERYLADSYAPLEGEHHPVAKPLAVNSPWA